MTYPLLIPKRNEHLYNFVLLEEYLEEGNKQPQVIYLQDSTTNSGYVAFYLDFTTNSYECDKIRLFITRYPGNAINECFPYRDNYNGWTEQFSELKTHATRYVLVSNSSLFKSSIDLLYMKKFTSSSTYVIGKQYYIEDGETVQSKLLIDIDDVEDYTQVNVYQDIASICTLEESTTFVSLDNINFKYERIYTLDTAFKKIFRSNLNYNVVAVPDFLLEKDTVEFRYIKVDQKHIKITSNLKVTSDTLFINQSQYSQIRTDIINMADYFINQIRVRYALISRPTSGLSNVVMDSYLPSILTSTLMYTDLLENLKRTIPKTAVAISPLTAAHLGIRQIPTEQLIRFLGYTPKDIKQLLSTVKKKELTISFAGYGGTGVNTIYWLTQLGEMTHTRAIFKKTYIYEKETIEFSNLLRFPKNPFELQISKNLDPTKLNLLTEKETSYLAKKVETVNVYLTHPREEHGIIYGAPNLECRQKFTDSSIPFISATHSDNSFSLYLNPTQDIDIQVETYGLIQLSTFFMNQLQMTISFLELLASNTDLHQLDTEHLTWEFDGKPKGKTDRMYNFQLTQPKTVATQEEAQHAF